MVLATVFVVTGCAGWYEMDLDADRRSNLTADLEILHQNDGAVLTGLLTPDDAVKIGLRNNLELRVSRLLIDIADDTARAEKLRMLPQLTVSGNMSYRDKHLLKEYEDLETGEIQLSNSISEERFRNTVRAGLTWNLLDFGLSFYRSRQAVHQSEVRRLERRRQAQTLALDIARAYRQAAMAEDNLDYIDKMATLTHEFKTAADALVADRRLDPIVAREIERQLASLAVTAGDIQAEVSGARITLCRLMGVSPRSRFDVSAEMGLFDQLEAVPDLATLNPENLESAALEHRPELFTADLQQRIQKDEAKIALVSLFPGIRLEGAWDYDANKYLKYNDWLTVGAGLVADLLALPADWQDYQARLKGVEAARFQRILLTASVIAQVNLAIHDIDVRQEQYRRYDAAYTVVEDLLRMTRERNNAGVEGFPDTLVTQRMVEAVVARLERSRKLSALLDARDTLAATLGLDHDRWTDAFISSEIPAGSTEPQPSEGEQGGAME